MTNLLHLGEPLDLKPEHFPEITALLQARGQQRSVNCSIKQFALRIRASVQDSFGTNRRLDSNSGAIAAPSIRIRPGDDLASITGWCSPLVHPYLFQVLQDFRLNTADTPQSRPEVALNGFLCRVRDDLVRRALGCFNPSSPVIIITTAFIPADAMIHQGLNDEEEFKEEFLNALRVGLPNFIKLTDVSFRDKEIVASLTFHPQT